MNLGFKELSSVCQAIASGRQSVLLRKAGLRESTSESGFQARSFYLLPTHYHEKGNPASVSGFDVNVRVQVIRSGDLHQWSAIEKLAPLTAYALETLRDHFDSRNEKLLHFALIRAFRLAPVWHLPPSPELSGCRSWFSLPPPPGDLQETPVVEGDIARQSSALLV